MGEIIKVDTEKMENMMFCLFEFIYCNRDGSVVFSDRMCEKYGFPKKVDNIYTQFRDIYIHPEYHKIFDEAVHQSDEGKRRTKVELQDISKKHWFRIVFENAWNDEDNKALYTVGSMESTDELQSFRSKAELMQEISKAAIEGHYVRVFILDTEMSTYSYFNQNKDEEDVWVSKDYSITFDEYVEEYAQKACSDNDKDIILSLKTDELHKAIEQGDGKTQKRYAVCEKDEIHWYMLEASFFKGDKSKILGLISCVDEEEQIKEKLKDAAVASEEANKAKSTFLANMSHEIRTPMNAIIGMSEILLEKELSADIRDDINTIRNAGTGLLSIINDILDFSKIESGKFEIVPVDYMLPSLLMDVCNMISVRLSDSPIHFLMSVNPELPCHILGDDIRIRQILMNLLGNSVKFTKKGFISLHVEGHRNSEYEWELEFNVVDTGIGIKSEDIDKIFGTFSQVDTRKNRAVTGSGLGLSISRSFAKMMGGDITVESEYGKGSTFTVHIKQEVRRYEPIGSVTNREGIKVLVLDNDEIVISSVSKCLEKLGVEFRVCRTFDKMRQFEDMTHVIVRKKFFDEVKQRLEFMFQLENIYVLMDNSDHYDEKYIKYKQIQLPLIGLQIINALNNKEIRSGYVRNKFDRSSIIPLEYARALVVDDNATNLQVAKGLLLPYKMNVDLADNGYKAIEMIKNIKYDIVFMDHMMPDMDGVETTKHIRSMEGDYFKNVPVIALTANAMSDAKEMFLKNGFDDFIAKPIELSELNRVLKYYVQKNAPTGYVEKYLADRSRQANTIVTKEISDKTLQPFTNINSNMSSDITKLIEQNNMLLNQNMVLLNSLLGNRTSGVMQYNDEVCRDCNPNYSPVLAGADNRESECSNVIPEINGRIVDAMYGGDKELYISVLKTYADDMESKSSEVMNLVEAKDSKGLAICAHAIKSASKNVGADALADVAYEMEKWGNDEDWQSINAKMDLFSRLLESIVKNVKDYLVKCPGMSESINNKKEAADGLDEKCVCELRDACENMDYGHAFELLNRLNEKSYPEQIQSMLDAMLKYCGAYEYDKLEALVNEL